VRQVSGVEMHTGIKFQIIETLNLILSFTCRAASRCPQESTLSVSANVEKRRAGAQSRHRAGAVMTLNCSTEVGLTHHSSSGHAVMTLNCSTEVGLTHHYRCGGAVLTLSCSTEVELTHYCRCGDAHCEKEAKADASRRAHIYSKDFRAVR